MRPGDSTDPNWRTRIKLGWNAAEDAHDVWVIQDEFDTDGAWMGMRVLDENGHWRGWITVEGAALGPPTQKVTQHPFTRFAPAPKPTTAAPAPYKPVTTSGDTSGWWLAGGGSSASAPPGGLTVGDTITVAAIYGKSAMLGPPPADGSFDGQRLCGTDGCDYRWNQPQKRWLRV